jgi:hypothetical protein
MCESSNGVIPSGWRRLGLRSAERGPSPLAASPGRVGWPESVAERALNLDARAMRSGAEAKSHSTDRAPDGARAGPRHVGGRPDQLLVGDDSVDVPYEGGQDDELEMGEVDRLAADPCLVARQVQSEIAGDEDVVGRVR